MKIDFKRSFIFYVILLLVTTMAVLLKKELIIIALFLNIFCIYWFFFRIDYGDAIDHIINGANLARMGNRKKAARDIKQKVSMYANTRVIITLLTIFSGIFILVGLIMPGRIYWYNNPSIGSYYGGINSMWWDLFANQNSSAFFSVAKVALILQISSHILYLIYKESYIEAKRKYTKLEKNEKRIFNDLMPLRKKLIISVFLYFLGIFFIFN